MKPAVLIVDDSPSTAHLAKLALSDLPCEVEVAGDAWQALDLVHGSLSPLVLVIDAYLPGPHRLPFFVTLHQSAPGAAMVLLIERGVATPGVAGTLPGTPLPAQVYKPLQPRRFASVVTELLHDRTDRSDRPAPDPPGSGAPEGQAE